MSFANGSVRNEVHGEFLPSQPGPIFLTLHSPRRPNADCVLVVPPFAEEMNKSRRLVAELGRALAAHGITLAIPDLFGTGDSAGNFGEATWEAWVDNLQQTCDWIESCGLKLSALLAIRFGAALACDALLARKLPPVQRTVLCQPVFDGKRHLQQFLRLRVMASRMSGNSGESIDSIRRLLRSGAQVEVAGYPLSPSLADSMERLSVAMELPHGLGEVDWIELARTAGAPVSAQARQLIERSASVGVVARTHTLVAEPFWGATEIVVDAGLVTAMCEFLSGASRHAGDTQDA